MKEANVCLNGARFTARQLVLSLVLAAPLGVAASGAAHSQSLNPPLVLSGNYDDDARTDILLLPRDTGWTTMPVASADSSGTFVVANEAAASFTGWAATPNVVPLTGDFNGDGLSDIALLRRAPATRVTFIAGGNGGILVRMCLLR